VKIGFDPRNTNKIYVFPLGQSIKFWVAQLTDRSRAYRDMTFYEAKLSIRLSKLASSEAASTNKDKQLTAEEEIQKRIDSASKRSKQNTVTTSNNARLKTIKENKKEALSNERKKRAVGNEPQKEAQTPPNNVKPFKKQDRFTHPDIPDDIYGDED
jgi:hypothetical protein